MIQKFGALCVLSAAVFLLFGASPPLAIAGELAGKGAPWQITEGGRSGGGGSSCSYDKDNNTCGVWPANLQECLEDCAYQHGRDIEACSRKKDKKKREACYAKANDKHATCKRDCEKKFKKE
jgi:hypothetical protein